MTRSELLSIYTWEELQDAMRDFDYYEALDGDLYLMESSLIETGLVNAARYEWSSIHDVFAADLGNIDPGADAWVVSPDFSYVYNIYDDDFDSVRDGFVEWMEEGDLFDEEENDESDELVDADEEQVVEESIGESECTIEALLFGM